MRYFVGAMMLLAAGVSGTARSDVPNDLPALMQNRALHCLESDRTNYAKMHLVSLNTPTIPDAVLADYSKDWRWSDTVVAALTADTPRVRLDLVSPKGQRYTWTLAFKKSVLLPRVVLPTAYSRGYEVPLRDLKLEYCWTEAGHFNPEMLSKLPSRRQRARRDLVAGAVLKTRDIEDVPDIEAGSSLLLVSSSQGVVLNTPAIALEPAFPGRAFRVKLENSSRTCSAWIWERGEVRDSPPPIGASKS